MELLRLDNLEKRYAVGKGRRRYKMMAVDDVSFRVKKGECVGLVGESGCGKSTLGRLITGLEPLTEGCVYFQGEIINSKTGPGKSGRAVRGRKLQMVFQDSLDAVNPRFTAEQIISEPLENFFHLNNEEKNLRIEELLNLVGLSPADRSKYPHQFSGGQLQRVCIARALASNPELIVLDEPLSSLDVSVQAQILNLLQDLKSELELAFILISHDLEAVYYLADSLIVMYGGKIMERIETMGRFGDMVHPYTLKLLSSTNTYVTGKQEEQDQLKSKRKQVEVEPEDISIDMIVRMEGSKGCPYNRRCPKVKDICKASCPSLRKIKPGHFTACHLL